MNEKSNGNTIPWPLYVVFFIVLLNSGYLLSIRKPGLPTTIMGICTIWLLLMAYRKIQIKLKMPISNLIALGLCFFIISSMIYNRDFANYKTYLQLIIYISAAFCIVTIYNFREFSIVYLVYMRIIAAISLIFYLLINYTNISLNIPIELNSANTYFYNAYVYFGFIICPQRNSGIFWEPGIYQGMLTMACLLAIIFMSRKQKILDLTLFMIAIVTTQSTTGYFMLILVVLLMFVKNLYGKQAAFLTFLICILASISVFYHEYIFRILASFQPQVFKKLIMAGNQSYIDRTIIPLADLKIALRNPIFGVGLNDQFAAIRQVAKQMGYYVNSQTSTITLFASTFGLVFASLYSFAWLRGIVKQKFNPITKLILIVLFTILLSTNIYNYVVFSYCLMFYLLKGDIDLYDSWSQTSALSKGDMPDLKINEDHGNVKLTPKVLLINVQSASMLNATGHTLRNLFAEWSNDRLMQICLDTNVNHPIVERIKTINIEWSWIPYEEIFRKIFKHFTGSKTSEIKPGINAGVRSDTGLGKLHDAIRGLLDVSPIFLPSSVLAEVASFNPDVIYTMGASVRVLRVSNRIAKHLRIGVTLHLMDNWPETKYTSSILVKPIRSIMLHELAKLHDHSGACLAISSKMAEYYEKRYSVKYYVAMNCIDHISDRLYRDEDGCIKFLYAGGLHLNRWKQLIEVAGCIEKMRNKRNLIELIAHIPDMDKQNFGDLLIEAGIIIRPYVPFSEMISVLAGADVLLLLESFDENIIEFTRYSMSTKIPEYMAAGRPILAYSPKRLASSEYILNTKTGIVAETQSELQRAIKRLILYKKARIQMAKNGIRTVRKYHTQKMMSHTMKEALTTKKVRRFLR